METYRLPFAFERRDDRLRVTNTGPDPVFWLRAIVHGPGVALSHPTPRLEPRSATDIRLGGGDLARDSMLVLQWLRLDGETYLCAVAL